MQVVSLLVLSAEHGRTVHGLQSGDNGGRLCSYRVGSREDAAVCLDDMYLDFLRAIAEESEERFMVIYRRVVGSGVVNSADFLNSR